MRTGLTKQEKTTDIWFDEKDPLIHIRTHNTALKKRLAAYAGQPPEQCRQTDADPEPATWSLTLNKMRTYKINDFTVKNSNQHYITRFGGQPDWITSPQWPVSLSWDNRPLKFKGQVRLND